MLIFKNDASTMESIFANVMRATNERPLKLSLAPMLEVIMIWAMFNAFRGADHFFSKKFPSVTFTPIAIYRGE